MADNNRYIQYQVTLTATDTSVTPTFQDITIPFVISDSSAPGVSLTPLSPDPTRDNTPTLTGTVTEDIGTVSAVQFQVDSTTGTWTDCSASDGSFNAASENFSCTTSALNDGTHTLYIRSTDSNGNTTSSGFASDTFTIDVTPPLALNLISPSNNAYINNERPSFTWKATSDATSGLAKYVLEIDNTSLGTDQPSGDFSIDNIPADRSSDFITAKYTVHYENFNDSDQTNNSISLVTKSSSEWGDTENDGKLREGRASWKLKAIDNAGNEVAASNGLFIDRTSPTVALTQVNTIPASSVNFVTTDKTPTFYGKITDPLSGGDSSLSQDENGPKIASGPKEVQITIEKRNGILYEEVTRATIQIEKAWYTCTDQEIADNTKQLCNKYLPFQFTHKENLAAGLYKITLTGKDTADNTTEASFSLDVTSLSEITTPEEAAIIEEEISSLPPAQQEVVKEQLEITKPAEVTGPSITDQLSEGIYNGKKTIAKVVAQFGDVTKFITERLSSSFISLIHSVGEKVAEAFQTTSRALAFAFNSLFDAGERIIAALNQGYNFLASNAPGVTRSLFLAGQNGFSAAIKNADASIKSKRAGVSLYGKLLSQTSYTVGSQLSQTLISLSSSTAANIQTLSDNTGVMIVRFGYLFIKEPTTISNVTVEIISPTSAKISWKTNTPTNGKVNYGLSETYSLDVQSEELTTTHEFVLTNLQPDTEYYFEVMSHGKMYVYDANRKFKTPAKANYN